MPARRRPRVAPVQLEDRAVPANILQVEPVWINPPKIQEFTPEGALVREITPPTTDPRDVVVSPNGDLQLFDGTFSPQLSTYHPDTGTWTSRTTPGWSTVNNLSFGGIAALGDYVYVTDMQTAYETPPFDGLIRFNMADDSVDRFGGGHGYIALCLGLDGYLYALGGGNGLGNPIDKYDPVTMAYLGRFTAPTPDGRGVAIGANGDYYVSDWGNVVYQYDSAGHFIRAQGAGNGAVDISTDGQIISGTVLMDWDLNVLGTVGDGNYHTAFASPQMPILTPILSHVESTALAYAEGDPATAVSNTITVTDNHSPTIAGATVSITATFAPGEDVLAFAGAGGISGSFDNSTGVLTLTGTASVADYQAALRAVTYANTSDTPSTAVRTVTFQVDDGQPTNNLSNVVSRDIAVTAVNDAPELGLPDSGPAGPQDADIAVNGLSVGDVDAAGGTETLALSVPQGTLRFVDLTGVTVVGGSNDTAAVTLSGTLADLDAALRDGNLLYRPPAGFYGTVPLGLTLDDGGNTGAGGPQTDTETLPITVNHVAPRLSGIEDKSGTFVEGRGRVRVTARLKASAVGPLTGATAAITGNFAPGEDVLTWVAQPGITGHYDPATGVLTLTGTAPVARYQRALRSVRFQDTSRDPPTAPRVVTFQVTDIPGPTGLSNLISRTVQVTPVNTAPVLTVPAVGPSGPANAALAINGISALDVDANGGVERLALRVSRGTIGFADLSGLTVVGGANDSNLLVVEGTLAQLNAALAGGNLVYHPPADFAWTAVLGLTLNDEGNGGLGVPRSSHKVERIRVG